MRILKIEGDDAVGETMFRINDTVEVERGKEGRIYSMYNKWAKKNLSYDNFELWKKTKNYYGVGNSLNPTRGNVIAINKHEESIDILCAVITDLPGIYIIGQEGLTDCH